MIFHLYFTVSYLIVDYDLTVLHMVLSGVVLKFVCKVDFCPLAELILKVLTYVSNIVFPLAVMTFD